MRICIFLCNNESHSPQKELFAILASETASSMVYRENREADFLGMLQGPLQRSFKEQQERRVAWPAT